MMGCKKIIMLILCTVLLSIIGCQREEKIDIRGEITSVVISDDNKVVSILVEGELEEDTSYDKASISIDESTSIYLLTVKDKVSAEELKEGIKVDVIFTGPIRESYPVQATAKIIRIIEQDVSDETSNKISSVEVMEAMNDDSMKLLKLEESNYASIDEALKKREDIDIMEWSPDESCIAFLISDIDWGGKMYLWHTGAPEPVEIQAEKDMICEFIWSPDSEYVIADIGTSISRTGYVVRSKDNALLYNIGYIGNFLWSPDSKFIAMTLESEEKSIALTELDGTTDIYLFNIETEEMQIIDKGTPEYGLCITSWDSDGTLRYIRSYVNEPDKSEELSYQYQ
ncbi:hypothetical protein DW1_1208 [Proteiniborus sp. DW1]|uniref:DUF3221 domain-containing protein n=1 Tax=Proteiniborus sp. DW1 TaxID=1889883 RepID=UPI00092E10C9|nr:DUF3221 domain-containing protein [Proteiniborus sp. DW1]SCG82781.1 hypothetical protein DW1_1208 [Proteiniborus sp. DW1]